MRRGATDAEMVSSETYGSRGRRRPRFPFFRLYSGSRESLPRPARARPGNRVRRRHGRADLQRRAAPAHPEEANLRAPDAVVSLHVSFINAGAELIETNTFGANRRKLATVPRGRARAINSTGVKLARDAREVTGRDVFIAGSIGPVGENGDDAGAARALRGAGLDPRGPRRRPLHRRDFLRPRRAHRRDRGRPPRLEPADRGLDDLRRGRRDPRRRDGARGRRAPLAGRRRGLGANHGAGLLAALAALEEMAHRRQAARRAAEHRPRQPVRRPRHLPARDARVLRRVRRARARPGRAADRRLLRHDAHEIAAIRSAVAEGRKPRARLDFEERELVVALGERGGRDGARRALRDRRVRRLRAARPAARRQRRRGSSTSPRRSRTPAASASSTSTTTPARAPG